MARYKGTQASHLYEKSMHTLCTIHGIHGSFTASFVQDTVGTFFLMGDSYSVNFQVNPDVLSFISVFLNVSPFSLS